MLFLVVRRSSLGFGSFLGGGVEGINVVLAVVRLSLCYSLCSIRSGGSLLCQQWRNLLCVALRSGRGYPWLCWQCRVIPCVACCEVLQESLVVLAVCESYSYD